MVSEVSPSVRLFIVILGRTFWRLSRMSRRVQFGRRSFSFGLLLASGFQGLNLGRLGFVGTLADEDTLLYAINLYAIYNPKLLGGWEVDP